jgi:hypothetical protein
MRVIVVGLGVQGRKRVAVAGEEVVGTVDPVQPDAGYRKLGDVPTDAYDAAVVCVPDDVKVARSTRSRRSGVGTGPSATPPTTTASSRTSCG